ncbi:MAG: site-specific DNA-methyltransferase [Desulfobacteraceae bacterium]|nr:site-specific DNA-methyltransferase [Desulfobacteraceae bacterium]
MQKLDPKIDGATVDIVGRNIERLKDLFPDVFTEGKIDFDALQETLGDYIDDRHERYSFTWNGKSRARRIAQTPSTGTLLPCPKESVNWNTTKNLFVEGDNLEVLKLLQKSYHKRVKMICIDPPYNTGGEFIYPDKYKDNLDTYLRYSAQVDGEGFKLSSNTETSGRYHTNWLNMMYPRLKLARNLLSDKGVIFITIDDNEAANLRRMCDEIFGEENFVATIAWKHTQQSKNDELYFSRHYNQIVVYRKSECLPEFRFPRTEEDNKNYSNPDNDRKGDWRSGDFRSPHLRKTLCFPIKTPSGKEIPPPENGWRWSEEEVLKKIASGEIVFNDDETRITRKIYLCNQKGRTPENVWVGDRFGSSRQANAEIKSLFGGKAVFDTPKPTALVKAMCQLFHEEKEYVVLDFFSGSCTTAHAILDLNREDKGNRRFVMVQLPEPCTEKSEAYKAGYKTIAEVGKERIRRSIKSIEGESSGDFGFKVFKLDASNIKPWDPDFDNLEDSLFNAVENIKPDRSEADVLYELLLKYGLDLAVPIEEKKLHGKTIYIIGAGALIVCLAKQISLEVVEDIAALKDELKPEVMRVVFKDSGFKDDVVKTNAVQILHQAGIDDVKSL